LSPDGAQPVDEGSPGSAGGGPGQPSEEEIRAAYEAELSRLTSTDAIAQSVVTLLNVGARRLAPGASDPSGHPGERDLEQARDAIDAVRGLLEVLERRIPRELAPLRDALSRLQMAYAQEASAGAPAAGTQTPEGGGGPAGPGSSSAGGGQEPQGPGAGEPGQAERPPGPGPAESSGRLWVPGR